MERRKALKYLGGLAPAIILSKHLKAIDLLNKSNLNRLKFEPTWESLSQYRVPDWFRDAKFGMWAHWGPQCQPEAGDWYARNMYEEGTRQYKLHLEKYGHPSVSGFKEVIQDWKAQNWNPGELVALYKKTGAKYFMGMANHHDNMDLFDSSYQRWNSVKLGPKKDIIGGWAKAARANGLPFGVSVHAAHAWLFYETAQRSDKEGAYKGIPYDGKLTKQEGTGRWWEGFDPQALYAQDHPLSKNSATNNSTSKQWNWGNGACVPDAAYCEKFLKRHIELIDKYEPDLMYFDDTALPLWPISDVGLKVAAHLYNKNLKKHKQLEAVVFGKILNEQQRKCMVWDIERGQANEIQSLPWQTDTCIGGWHYDRSIYDRHGYKSAKTVIQMLVDIVSKNGNLLLNIPVRGDGTIDEQEQAVVEEIGDWMRLNSESIYATRPWKQFGEGPALENVAALKAQGFNEGKGKSFVSQDIRFAQKGDILYATVMAWPENETVLIKSLSRNNYKEVSSVKLLSKNQQLKHQQTEDGLVINFPAEKPLMDYAHALKIV